MLSVLSVVNLRLRIMKRVLLPLLFIASLASVPAQEPPSIPATLQSQLADESQSLASRTWALSLHATFLYATGEASAAAKLLDDWSQAHAGQPLPAAYYSARFFIAWLGQGDEEAARRQLAQMDELVAKGSIPADDPHYTLMTQSYYNHLLASKMERATLYAKRLGGG